MVLPLSVHLQQVLLQASCTHVLQSRTAIALLTHDPHPTTQVIMPNLGQMAQIGLQVMDVWRM